MKIFNLLKNKISCKHSYEILGQAIVKEPSEQEIYQANRSGWGARDYTLFSHPRKEFLLVCKKCGETKTEILVGE